MLREEEFWYKILAVVNIKIMVFWDMIPGDLVDRYQPFGGTYCSTLVT
jgi:hypothetical protein